jgi:hypothetical protein
MWFVKQEFLLTSLLFNLYAMKVMFQLKFII